MKTLYIECFMGCAGDMLTAALLELSDNKSEFLKKMNSLSLHGVTVEALPASKCGISGTSVSVKIHGHEEGEEHDHEHEHEHGHHEHGHEHEHEHGHEHGHHEHHEHSGYTDITGIISGMDIPEAVKADALAVYALLADAESAAHGKPVNEVHFHEVGSLDAIADIVGACLLINDLSPERIIVSPVTVGFGQVRAAHGILPVPAPATAHILRGVPTRAGRIEGEMCTPTGAALLRHFADKFELMPAMRAEKIGIGCGKKDFEAANCVRAFLGESAEGENDAVAELFCNLDDMTGEAVAYACSVLMENGALDVYTEPIYMKKGRPAVKLCVICRPDDADAMAVLMLRHTTTIGVRRAMMGRYILSSRFEERDGVRIKISEGFGVKKSKPEFSDLEQRAKATGGTI